MATNNARKPLPRVPRVFAGVIAYPTAQAFASLDGMGRELAEFENADAEMVRREEEFRRTHTPRSIEKANAWAKLLWEAGQVPQPS
jgi:hypothetical protein